MENERISHYRLGRFIARGAMGEVYEAVDLDLGRKVALKFLAPELAADSESLKRFEREALAAAALNHPHIATLHAFERAGGRPLIAMELLTGGSLRARLGAGPLPVAEAIGIVRDVADALGYAHRRQVVHRDIKPENLMFDEHGRIKITDFGLAQLARSTTVTVAGTILGTPSHMAPESVRGETGAPADVFALGVVLYESLAGRQPFMGANPMAVLYAITNEEPAPLRSVCPEVPEEVEALCARMLAKPPGDRPAAAEVAAALGGRAVPYVVLPVAEATAGSATPPARAPRRLRPRTIGLVVLGVVLIAATATIASRMMARRAREALAYNNRGIEALQRDDLASARGLFERSLELDPSLGRARINLGMIQQQQGHRERAEALFTEVLKRHRGDPPLLAQAHYNLGSLDLDSGAWESAAENLATSFELDSSTARVYNNYGLALVRVGRAGEALALLERGIDRFPGTAPLQKNAGFALLSLDRPGEALPYFDRALALDSTLAEARTLRDEARRRAGIP